MNRRTGKKLIVSVSVIMLFTACQIASQSQSEVVMPVGAPSLFRVIMPVSDIAKAEAFYQRVLGVPAIKVSNGRRYFDCNGVILACLDPRADGDAYDAAPMPEWVYFAVDDLEARYKSCEDAKAVLPEFEISGDPAGRIAARPWGERSFYALDPFGNKLCFVDRKTTYTGKRPTALR